MIKRSSGQFVVSWFLTFKNLLLGSLAPWYYLKIGHRGLGKWLSVKGLATQARGSKFRSPWTLNDHHSLPGFPALVSQGRECWSKLPSETSWIWSASNGLDWETLQQTTKLKSDQATRSMSTLGLNMSEHTCACAPVHTHVNTYTHEHAHLTYKNEEWNRFSQEPSRLQTKKI